MQRIDRNTMEAGVESIFKMLAQRVDDNQMLLVRKAYELAAEAHKEQKRKTGEPYIIHPIAVARIVAEELELGANPVMAAFLHDVVEDSRRLKELSRCLSATVPMLTAWLLSKATPSLPSTLRNKKGSSSLSVSASVASTAITC